MGGRYCSIRVAALNSMFSMGAGGLALMSEVTCISRVGQPRVCVQLTPGRREVSGWRGNSGFTRKRIMTGLSPVRSVSSVKHICYNFIMFATSPREAFKNKHCEILVSCSNKERNCMQAHETACRLIELHVISLNFIKVQETACKLREQHASSCIQANVTAFKLM